MTTVVSKFGDGLGLRIPNNIAQQLRIADGDTVEIAVEDGALIVRPQKKRITIEELVAEITPENRHDETDWGSPRITARRVHYTYDQYLSLEEASTIRHEYLDGEIYAMAGGSPDHAALAARVIALLQATLPPGCRVFSSDLRIRIEATGLSTYPDAAVVCGATARAAVDRMAVTNPAILVEITSPSTEEYDRVEKLRHYTHLESLQAVLIVSHREPRVSLHLRTAGWAPAEAGAGDHVELLPGVTLAVGDLYRDPLEDAVR